MADYVGSSQEALALCASKSINEANAIEGVVRNIDSLVGEVLETWKGESATSFENLWRNDLKGKFLQASTALQDLAKEVQRQAAKAAEDDKANAAAFGTH